MPHSLSLSSLLCSKSIQQFPSQFIFFWYVSQLTEFLSSYRREMLHLSPLCTANRPSMKQSWHGTTDTSYQGTSHQREGERECVFTPDTLYMYMACTGSNTVTNLVTSTLYQPCNILAHQSSPYCIRQLNAGEIKYSYSNNIVDEFLCPGYWHAHIFTNTSRHNGLQVCHTSLL